MSGNYYKHFHTKIRNLTQLLTCFEGETANK